MRFNIAYRVLSLLLLFPALHFGQIREQPMQEDQLNQLVFHLDKHENDQFEIDFYPAITQLDSVYLIFPKVVPGTYSISNFGRFVQELQITDASGNDLKFKKIDYNKWVIYNARSLYKIHYKVDDSFDDPIADQDIFRPGGTSFSDSLFLLNLFGVAGYLDGKKDTPYRLTVHKPTFLYGSTALENISRSATTDIFTAENYFNLHDKPILYAIADTASTMVFNTKVEVASYSQSSVLNASEILETSASVLMAIGNYLGGNLPAERYVILSIAENDADALSGYGALEHHNSTVLYMPEFEKEVLLQEIRDIVAHEFLHIVTPLSLHSEYIHGFDFYNPEMSSHLWFFEGITEYTSHLVQVRYGLQSPLEFLGVMKSKMDDAELYNLDIPMTVMSRNVLDIFKSEYSNVYDKGALIGMALDLKLRILSDGKKGLVDLMSQLSAEFGSDTFFEDDQLFRLIEKHTDPSIREFLARYVEGAEPLPFEELLAEAGVLYIEETTQNQIGFGQLPISFDPDLDKLYIYDNTDISPMSKALGLEVEDRLLSLNGEDLTIDNAADLFGDFYSSVKEGDKLKMEVLRLDKKGKWKKKKLKTKVFSFPVVVRNTLLIDNDLTAQQQRVYNGWLNL